MSNSFDPTTPLGSYPEFPLKEVEFLLGVKDGKPVRIRNEHYVAPGAAVPPEAVQKEAPKPESKPITKKLAAKKAAAPKKDDD